MKLAFRSAAAALLATLLLPTALQAQDGADAVAEEQAAPTAEAFLGSLQFRTGDIALPNGKAQLRLSEAFQYLEPADAQRLIEQGWGNPPGSGEGVLGMLVPANVSPLDDKGWGVIITYSDDGHVSDEDADEIDYAELLGEMQQQSQEDNEARRQQGFPTVELVGWAEDPHYDKLAKKIYWAKDLAFDGSDAHTLNYAIRVLGREGVLELNAVAGLDQLDAIKQEMKQVVAFTEFTEGNRYADYNADTDKVAAYGLAALVAGGIAAKKGLFAAALLLLAKFWKLGLVALAVFGGALGKFFGRKRA